MTLENGLWFHNHDENMKMTASLKQMNVACYNNLWHGRLGHSGDKITSQIHKHVKGVKKQIIEVPIFKCGSCLPNKMRKLPHHQKTNKAKTQKEKRAEKLCQEIQQTFEKRSMDDPEATEDINIIDGHVGQHFHMNFGFVRGT